MRSILVLSAIFVSLGASSCAGHAPLIDICISDPALERFECVDKKQNAYTLPYKDSENYIATPPNDFETLLNYCKTRK